MSNNNQEKIDEHEPDVQDGLNVLALMLAAVQGTVIELSPGLDWDKIMAIGDQVLHRKRDPKDAKEEIVAMVQEWGKSRKAVVAAQETTTNAAENKEKAA